MKKCGFTLLVLSILCGMTSNAYAGDKEWAAAGKILTGFIGLNILAEAIHDSSPVTYVSRRPDRCYRNTVRYYEPRQCWVPGHYQIVQERVWIPGETRKIWVPAKYCWKWRNGRKVKVRVRDGYYRYENVDGHYETVKKKIWVEGYWKVV